ncbi:MAG: hypothetical protein U0361_20485 [Nitrospiraceae bacterium]
MGKVTNCSTSAGDMVLALSSRPGPAPSHAGEMPMAIAKGVEPSGREMVASATTTTCCRSEKATREDSIIDLFLRRIRI